jgi:hypothetical protein
MLSTINDIRDNTWSFFNSSLYYYLFLAYATILIIFLLQKERFLYCQPIYLTKSNYTENLIVS